MSLTPNIIFESAFDDELFYELPTRITRAFGARSMIFHLVSKDGAHSVTANSGYWPKEQLEAYSKDFVEKDILWSARANPQNLDRAWNIIDGLISREEFEKSQIVNEHYRKFGDDLTYAIGGIFNTSRGQMAIGIHRGKNSEPFSTSEVNQLNNLSPKLINMLMTRQEIAKAKNNNLILQKVVEDTAKPFVHTDFANRLLNYNGIGIERILLINGLRNNGNNMIAINKEGKRILETIEHLRDADGNIEKYLKLENQLGAILKIQKICLAGTMPQLILSIEDKPKSNDQIIEFLQKQYELTTREAHIAILIADGKTINEVAEERNVSRNTIKSQLNQVYFKTNCPKQSKLAGLIKEIRLY